MFAPSLHREIGVWPMHPATCREKCSPLLAREPPSIIKLAVFMYIVLSCTSCASTCQKQGTRLERTETVRNPRGGRYQELLEAGAETRNLTEP